jgi:hypothetical protein
VVKRWQMGRGDGRGGRRSALQFLILGSARKKRGAIRSVEMDLGARRAHCGRRSRKAADHRTAQRQGPSCKQSQALICVSAPGNDKVARPSGAADQSVVGVRVRLCCRSTWSALPEIADDLQRLAMFAEMPSAP